MASLVVSRLFAPTNKGHQIIVLQSPESRALNVGSILVAKNKKIFTPGRLTLAHTREHLTYTTTVQSLQQPQVKKILARAKSISTITILRETLACRLGSALFEVGISRHYGDAFIGATHIKGDGDIKTAYLYENTEGLTPDGLWILADSICMGRNTSRAFSSLLAKFHPREILVLGPIASRRGINIISDVIATHAIPTTFVAWGALFGVDEKSLYDMPWGHKDTEPLYDRDQQFFLDMYGPKLCVGGDFGNDYYSPELAIDLYKTQLRDHSITPHIPSVSEALKVYTKKELVFTKV